MRRFLSILLIAVCCSARTAVADTFTVREDDGQTVVVEARLLGEDQGMIAIERTDGRIEIIPRQQLINRELGVDPEPITCAEMIERLTVQFGEDKFRSISKPPFVIGLILSEKLDKKHKGNVEKCLRKGIDFMKKVEKGFLDFVSFLKIETEESRYPLVVLVFETDDDFIKFHAEETGGRGLSAEATQGYYNRLTNRLVIRMSECFTFSTPLHEAVHQQVYNRGILQRLAHIPVWFDEGIATGFEGDGNGEKIKNGPSKINVRYARKARMANSVDWNEVIAQDKAFRGDILAGEAYANAWSMHWFLLTKYHKKYVEYLQLLRLKQPLQPYEAPERIKDFETVFGKSIRDLQSEFPTWLDQEARRTGVNGADHIRDGYLLLHSNLAQVEMSAVKNGETGELQAAGQMRNISQIRPMSFHITMETDGGTYAEWFLSNVPPLKVMPLHKQIARRQMKDSPRRPSDKFWIKIKSAVPESETGKEWQANNLPVPVFSGN